MSYEGRYIDRNPHLIAAGIRGDTTRKIEDCFLHVSLEDGITALKHEAGIDDENHKKDVCYPSEPSPRSSKRFEGFETEVKSILSPPHLSTFEKLQKDFQETIYDSYWNKAIGKTRDQTSNLPKGLDVNTFTFGESTKSDVTLAELVSPQKLPGQVLFEADIAHDLYAKTHSDYHPGEQVNRNYLGPGFDPCAVFGVTEPWLDDGGLVKRCVTWHNPYDTISMNRIQADFKAQTQPKVGKVLAPNHILESVVAVDHTFGKASVREMCGVPEVLMDCPPSLEKRNEADYMSHINTLRIGVKKIRPEIVFFEFEMALKCRDEDETGWLPLATVYSICEDFNIRVERRLVESLMRRAAILDADDRVKYMGLAAMLNWKMYDFPPMSKLGDVPPEYQHYESTYQAASRDGCKIDNRVARVAGVPSVRYDLQYPVAEINAYKDSLPGETDMRAVISPSIFTRYGLSHRDFFMPRDKNTIIELFTNIGVRLTEDKFSELYEEALLLDKTGGVCIETFRNLLDRRASEAWNRR